MGVVDQPLPADRRARLLEVDPHHDRELVGELLAPPAPAAGRSQGPPPRRGRCRDQRRPAGDRRRSRTRRPPRGCATTACARCGPSGSSLEQPRRRDQLKDPLDSLIADAVSPLLASLRADHHLRPPPFSKTRKSYFPGLRSPDGLGIDHATELLSAPGRKCLCCGAMPRGRTPS